MNSSKQSPLIVPHAPSWLRPGYGLVVGLITACILLSIFSTYGSGLVRTRPCFGACAFFLSLFLMSKIGEVNKVFLDRENRFFYTIDMVGRKSTGALGGLAGVKLFSAKDEQGKRAYKAQLLDTEEYALDLCLESKRAKALAKAKKAAIYLDLPIRDETSDVLRVYSPEEVETAI